MVKKICRAVASCITVIVALTFAELPGASAIQEKHQRKKNSHSASRHNRAARKRVKAQRKPVQTVSYVCPMHLDIRSSSRGTCPKCLMDLVAKGRDAKGTLR